MILTLGLIFSLPGYAQKKIYTLDEAILTALQNNREVKIARLNVEKSEAAVNQAFGYALPSVDLAANFSHFLLKPKTPFPDFEALLSNATYSILFDEAVIPRDNSKYKPVETALQSFVQANNYETSVQVTQTLFNSAVFRGIGASQIYAQLYKQELDRITAEVILTVKKSFYGVLLTRELYDIMSASYQNAKDNLKNVRALNSEGLVSEFDMLQAEVRVDNINPVVLQMENTLRNITSKLKIVLGVEQSADIDVEGEISYQADSLGMDEAIAEALRANASIKSLVLKAQVDEEFIALDRAEYWPALYAFGNYSYAGSGEQFGFQNYSSSIVGLTFSMNLWSGNRTKNKVEQSEIGLRQTQEQISQLKDFVISQTKEKLNDLNRVRLLIETQERNVNLAQRAYDIAVVRYKEGTGSQLEIENADVALRQARINRLQVIFDYIVASAELDLLLGKTDPAYYNSTGN
jgi:outer membrane protein TolC